MKFKTGNAELVKRFLGEIEERERLETNLKQNLKINSNFKQVLIAFCSIHI